MSCKNQNFSGFLILIKLLLLFLLIFYSAVLHASSSCLTECGGVQIQYPFGTGSSCYLEKAYNIDCRRNTSRKLVPFLSINGQEVEVVNISLPYENGIYDSLSFASVRIRFPIISTGCSAGGNDSVGSDLNLKGTPFFVHGKNRLVAAGCNSKVFLTHISPNMVGCELNCSLSTEPSRDSIPFFNTVGCSNTNGCTENRQEETGCDGNGCCQTSLPDEPRQVIGIRIESKDDVSSTTTREDPCRVAFLTDELYTLANAIVPRELFAKRYATLSLGWVIQTKNHWFLNSLVSKPENYCYYDGSNISESSYASCGCNSGYNGNPYDSVGCRGQYKFLPSLSLSLLELFLDAVIIRFDYKIV